MFVYPFFIRSRREEMDMTYGVVARRWGSKVPSVQRSGPGSDVAALLGALGVSHAAAEREWRAVLDHKWYVSERVGRDVGLKTAVVDYFENVRPPSREAPKGIEGNGDPVLLEPWTFLGFPTISLNGGLSPNGLPLGLQFAGAPREDYKLMQTGAWCERVLGNLPPPPMV